MHWVTANEPNENGIEDRVDHRQVPKLAFMKWAVLIGGDLQWGAANF